MFILVLNRTAPNYKGGSAGTELRFFNASETSAVISNLAQFEEYLIFVYLVDFQRYVFKSHQIFVRTDEGGKASLIGAAFIVDLHVFNHSLTLSMTMKNPPFPVLLRHFPFVPLSDILKHCSTLNSQADRCVNCAL